MNITSPSAAKTSKHLGSNGGQLSSELSYWSYYWVHAQFIKTNVPRVRSVQLFLLGFQITKTFALIITSGYSATAQLDTYLEQKKYEDNQKTGALN